MTKHVFGPVPSRRLGISLGVDLIPRKVCSFDCVYCECGATTKLTVERKEYVPQKQIEAELISYFKNNADPEYITLSGSGEPTLNLHFGQIIRFIKRNWSHIPVAVLTNGSLLGNPEVRKELMEADPTLPSLDAASQQAFIRINKPAKGINIQDYIQGLVDFRKEYRKEIWLEVLILPGFNDSKKELDLLKDAFQRIEPDIIQINSLDRPGRVEGLRGSSHNELLQIKEYWNLKNVQIIPAAVQRKQLSSYSPNIEETILGTIQRRPCTVQDLSTVLGIHVNEVNKYLAVLEGRKVIRSIRETRGLFYAAKEQTED